MSSAEILPSSQPFLSEQDQQLVEELSQKLRRDVNCLSEKDRTAKRRAMERICKDTVNKLSANSTLFAVTFAVCETLLLKPVLRLMSDSVERCRCLSVEFLHKFVPAMSYESMKQCLPYIIPTLTARLAGPELVEPSEELRLSLLELLAELITVVDEASRASRNEDGVSVDRAHLLSAYIPDLSEILIATLTDPFHEVKKESCKCVSRLAVAIPRHFQLQAESFIKPLITCLVHQHSKVRMEGLRTLTTTILHGPVKCIESSLSALGQRAFDQTPTVRLLLAVSVATLLREYVDRYSFHHRLLPLLLSGLTDEVEEIRIRSKELFLNVGAQYLDENEQDMKDETDFGVKEEGLSVTQRSIGCCVLIQRNLSKIIPPLLRDMQEWTVSTRIKSVSVLCMVLSLAGRQSTQQLPSVLASLYGAGTDEDDLVRQKAFECADELGRFLAVDTLCDLLLSAISTACGGTSKLSATIVTSPAAAVSALTILSRCLQSYNDHGRSQEAVQASLERVVSTLCQDQVCHSQEGHHQLCLLHVVKQLFAAVTDSTLSQLSLPVFTLLVKILTLANEEHVVKQTQDLISELAVLRGVANSSDLFADHMSDILRKLNEFDAVSSSSVVSMATLTPILQGAGAAVAVHLDTIIPLLERSVSPDVTAAQKLDFFEMLAGLLERVELTFDAHSTFSTYIVHIIKTIYLPGLIWKPGRALAALRATVTGSLLILLHCRCVEQGHCLEVINELLPPVFSVMDDDGTPAGRDLALKVLQRLLQLGGSAIDVDCLHRIYPELMKRMDDSDDLIRITCTRAWSVYFQCFPTGYDSGFYGAHLDVIYKGLLIHMDDRSSDIQAAVLDVLREGGRFDRAKLLKMIEEVKSRHRTQMYCDQLSAHLSELDTS